MKKDVEMDDELCPEYDLFERLQKGVRGKYADRYKEGINLVLLAPDVAEAFQDEEAINEVLRLVKRLSQIPMINKKAVTKN